MFNFGLDCSTGTAIPVSMMKRSSVGSDDALAGRLARLKRGDCITDILDSYITPAMGVRCPSCDRIAHYPGLHASQAWTLFSTLTAAEKLFHAYAANGVFAVSFTFDAPSGDGDPAAGSELLFSRLRKALYRRYRGYIASLSFDPSGVVTYTMLIACDSGLPPKGGHRQLWRDLASRYSFRLLSLASVDTRAHLDWVLDQFDASYFAGRRYASAGSFTFSRLFRVSGVACDFLDRQSVMGEAAILQQRKTKTFVRLVSECFGVSPDFAGVRKVCGRHWNVARWSYISTLWPSD